MRSPMLAADKQYQDGAEMRLCNVNLRGIALYVGAGGFDTLFQWF